MPIINPAIPPSADPPSGGQAGRATQPLDEERFDLHSGKKFKIRDFRVTREHGRNWLVSPYYEEGGGTVIDWMPPEWADE